MDWAKNYVEMWKILWNELIYKIVNDIFGIGLERKDG